MWKNGVTTVIERLDGRKYPYSSGLQITDDDIVSWRGFDGNIYPWRDGGLDNPFTDLDPSYTEGPIRAAANGIGAALSFDGLANETALYRIDLNKGTSHLLMHLGRLTPGSHGAISNLAESSSRRTAFVAVSGTDTNSKERVCLMYPNGIVATTGFINDGACGGVDQVVPCHSLDFSGNDGFAINSSGLFVGTLFDYFFTGVTPSPSWGVVLDGDPGKRLIGPGDIVAELRVASAENGPHAINDSGQVAVLVNYPHQGNFLGAWGVVRADPVP